MAVDRPPLFDTRLLAARRTRAMRLGFAGGADFLHREAAESIAQRVAEINRPFAEAAVVGSGAGAYARALAAPGRSVRQIECSAAMAEACPGQPELAAFDPLPLSPASLDLVVSGLWLHWSNDLVGQLIQMRRALRPDGLMIAVLFGEQTLADLRMALAEAETAISGGLSPRIAPMAGVRDLGALLQRAGFAMPVADVERRQVSYATTLDLMRDLRAMGETNLMAGRRLSFTPRALLLRAAETYAKTAPAEAEGRVSAVFDMVFLTGWAPAEDQPKPLRPGSATARLAEALRTEELPAGDSPPPQVRPSGD